MTIQQLIDQLQQAPDKSATVWYHGWITEKELKSLLARCEEIGAGPNNLMTLQLEELRSCGFENPHCVFIYN